MYMYTRKLFLMMSMVIIFTAIAVCSIHCSYNKLTGFTCDMTHVKDTSRMQFGTVIFYFEHDPIVNYIPSRNKQDSLVFFFPQIAMPASVYHALSHALKIHKNDCIDIQCHRVYKPIEGMELVILYDPDTVIVDRKMLRSSRLEPGVSFNFYNKQLIETLKNKSKGVLNISYRYKKVNGVYFANA